MAYYFIPKTGYSCVSRTPNLTSTTFNFNMTINGVELGKAGTQWRSSATTLTNFKAQQQTIGLLPADVEFVEVWCCVSSSSPYGTMTDWTNVTSDFTISIPDTETIVLTPNDTFDKSGSYVELYLSINERLGASTFTVNTNCTNCTCTTELASEYDPDTPIEVGFTANNGYKFKDGAFNATGLSGATVNISEDGLTATVSGTITDNVVITATASELYYVYITGTFKNCSCNYSNGEEISTNKPQIIITAVPNAIFDGIFEYQNGNYQTLQFQMNEDKNILTADIDDGNSYYLSDDYVAVKEVETISDLARIYNPTDDELTELSKVRFQNDVDYGTYISALYKMPFPVPVDLLTPEKRNIILGTYDTNLIVNALTTYLYTIDLGSITVPEKYMNAYDFLTTECALCLPYFGKVFLEPEYVIGQTISISYTMDLYSGNTTANISSSFTGGVIETMSSPIVINIPFMARSNSRMYGAISGMNTNVIDTAYIEIKRDIPYNVDSIFGREVIEYGKIGDYTDFIKVENVILNSKATNEEKNEIMQMLREGVIING